MSDYAVEVEGLRKTYADFALRDVTFSLPAGHVMGLVGPNGAGKTTIIKLIMNLIRPESGAIRLFGLDHRAHEAEVKARIGWVYDVSPFYGDATLRTTARAIAPFYQDWDPALFGELVDRFELPLRKKLGKLSKGMQTKFALAVALSHRADLLLLDEPTTGLDPAFRRELLRSLSGLLQAEGKSILFSTHITTDLERIADWVTFIRGGEIRLVATADELRDRWAVVRGDAASLSTLPPELRRGVRGHAHGVDVLTPDAEAARAACGHGVVVDRASLEDVVVLLDREVRHA
jgi:ABC-2 type transport system ATP-binding protein